MMLARWFGRHGLVLAAYLLTAILFLSFRAPALRQPNSHPTPWDSGWYANIWVHGYAYDPHIAKQQNIVFFPLYPLLCAMADHIWHFEYPHNTMLAVSLVLSLLSVIYLYKLLEPIYGGMIATRATALFIINPFAIYLFNGYSEAAWILCIILFFYFLVAKDNPYIAALCVAVGSTSRPYGIILLAVLIFHLSHTCWRKSGSKSGGGIREIRAASISIPLCFLGLVIYTTYSWKQFGDPMAFQKGMAAWGVVAPFHVDAVAFFTLKNVFYNLIHPYWGEFPHPRVPVSLLHPFSVAAVFFLAIPALLMVYRKRIPATLLFFIGFFMAFYYVRGYEAPWLMMNLGRYLMVCFPFSIALAFVCGKPAEAKIPPADGSEAGKAFPVAVTTMGQVFSWRFGLVLLAFAVLFAMYTYEFYCVRWIS